MNRLKSLIPAIAIVAMASLTLAKAQAETVLVTVNIDAALSKYYKAVAFAEEFQKSEEEVNTKADPLREELKKLESELEDLKAQVESDILSDEAKEEAKQEASVTVAKYREGLGQLNAYFEQASKVLGARRTQQLNIFYREIAEVVQEVATEKNAGLVFDISARAQDGRAPILYTDGSMDITEQVVEIINATEGQEEPAAPAAE